MKKLFLGSVALVALGLAAPAALAADRAVPAYAPPPPPAPVYTWRGCYIGANAGNSNGRSTHTTTGNSLLTTQPGGFPTLAPVPAGSSIAGDLNLSGFIGGFQGGCNYQAGMWVIGFEGDGQATNKEGQNFEVGLVPFFPVAPGTAGRGAWISQTQERWLVTARGRLGFSGRGLVWGQDASVRDRRRCVGQDRRVRVSHRRSDRHRPSREQHPQRLDGGRRLGIRARLRLVGQGRISLCQVRRLHHVHLASLRFQ